MGCDHIMVLQGLSMWSYLWSQMLPMWSWCWPSVKDELIKSSWVWILAGTILGQTCHLNRTPDYYDPFPLRNKGLRQNKTMVPGSLINHVIVTWKSCDHRVEVMAKPYEHGISIIDKLCDCDFKSQVNYVIMESAHILTCVYEIGSWTNLVIMTFDVTIATRFGLSICSWHLGDGLTMRSSHWGHGLSMWTWI